MQSRILAAIVLMGSIPIVGTAAEPAAPIALHPANPHYFLWRGKPTILITSAEHYGAVLNTAFDFVPYLDELKAHGLNHTRTFSGVYREIPGSFGITDNTLAPHPGKFLSPWARSSQPGDFDGGNKFDLTKWDEAYFKRLKDFVKAAGARGVVVELTLFCPMYEEELWNACPMNARNNVNGVGKCGRNEVYTTKHKDLLDVQLAVARKIVAELREFDNLYYEVCNEPYFGGVTMEWQHRIVDAIIEAEKGFPRRHLISLNIANGRQKVENPHPGVSIFNFHYCVPPDVVAMNYGLNKVIGENETGFRGSADVLYRTEAWDFLLAGGGLYNNLDYSFSTTHPGGTLRDYKSPGGGSRELRAQLRVLKEFLEAFDFVKMRPDISIIRSVAPELTASALAEPGKSYAIYLHVPLPDKPKDLKSLLRTGQEATLSLAVPVGAYRCEWIDPLSGKALKSDEVKAAGGTLTLKSPKFDNDIALRVVRR